MAWPNPFQRDDENTRSCWGFKFQWSHLHYTPEELEPLKFSCDELADQCLNILDSIYEDQNLVVGGEMRDEGNGKEGGEEGEEGNEKRKKKDLYELLKENHDRDEMLGRLWGEVHGVPEWVDWEAVKRGQDVFYRYAGVALTSVSFLLLLLFF